MRNISLVTTVFSSIPFKRLWWVVALVAACAFGIYTVMSHMIFVGFARIEREQAARDLARCSDAIRSEVSHLDQVCGDWALWDDTYQFMENRNAGYLHVNVDWPTLEKISGINVLFFCQSDGSIFWAQGYEQATGGAFDGVALGYDLSRHYPCLFEHTTDDSVCCGIVLTARGPILLSSRPVLKSDGKGPSRGTIIMGRLLNSALLTALKEQTKVPFRISVLDKSKLSAGEVQALKRLDGKEYAFDALDRNVLTGLGSLSDVQNNPALMLRAELPRDVTKHGRITIQLATGFAVATFVLIVSLLFFLFTLYLIRCRRGSELSDGEAEEGAELFEAQELFRAAAELAPCGIVVADAPDVAIRSANAAALAIRGGDPAQLVGIGLPLHALRWQILKVDGTPYPPEQLPLSRAVNDGKHTRDETFVIRDEAGQDHRVVASAAPIRDAQGRVTAGVLIFQDVTDRASLSGLI